MKTQVYIRLVFSSILVILIVGSGLAQGAELDDPSSEAGVNAVLPANASWFRETIDSTNDVGQHVSVAIDPVTGTTCISYYDATEKELRMAKHVGSGGNCGLNNSWNCETVDDSGEVGQYSSIAINPSNGLPGIAYYDATNYALKLAIEHVFDWTITTIDDPLLGITGLYTSLKFDSNGKPHIAYYSSTFPGSSSLRYAKYVGGGAGNCTDNDYQCDAIDGGDQVGKYASLALDSSDLPRIAYYDGGNNTLMYAYQNGGSWMISEILPVNSGKYASLVVDVNNGNLPHIAHFNTTNNRLEYAVYDMLGNGNCGFDSSVTKFMWQCDTIEDIGSSSAPRGVDIAVDGTGLPIIAYQNAAEGPLGTLKVARPVAALNQLVGNCGPAPSLFYTWQCDTLLPLGPNYNIYYRPADYVGIDLNSAGLATIAYYGNATNDGGDLQVTYQRLQVFLPLVLRQSP